MFDDVNGGKHAHKLLYCLENFIPQNEESPTSTGLSGCWMVYGGFKHRSAADPCYGACHCKALEFRAA